MTRLTLPIALLFALLLAAPPARAEIITMGSDLQGSANVSNSHPRDWAAWPTAYGSQPAVATTVTKQGEVAVARLKGRIIQSVLSLGRIPPVVMHVVVMRPQPDGSAKLVVSTEDLPLPLTGDTQQIATHDLQSREARICVQPGDYVALATSGGFGNIPEGGFPEGSYADGVNFQMFSRLPGSSISLFEQAAGSDTFQVGDDVRAVSQPAQELLMQVAIGTREHARFFCRTKAEQAENIPNPTSTLTPAPTAAPPPGTSPEADGKASIPPVSRPPRIRRGIVKIGVRCDGPKPCAGNVTLTNNNTKYGAARFALAVGAKAFVPIKINRACKRRLKKGHGKVSVKATARTAAGSSSRRFVIRKA